jgi:hypothetical protein
LASCWRWPEKASAARRERNGGSPGISRSRSRSHCRDGPAEAGRRRCRRGGGMAGGAAHHRQPLGRTSRLGCYVLRIAVCYLHGMKDGRIERAFDAAHRVARTACQVLAIFCSVCGFVLAFILTLYQIGHWLRWGVWQKFKSADLMNVSPRFLEEWIGVRQVLDWALDTPMQVALIVGGLAAGLICMMAANLLDPPAAR